MKNTLKYTLLTLALAISAPTMAKSTATPQNLKAKATQSQQQASKVSLNSASVEMLASKLKGVGVTKAHAIITYRRANGPFKSVDELAKVKGIGAATIAKNIQVLAL